MSIDDSQRSHQGNLGYRDELGVQYVWDSKVSNCKRVSVGDLLVLRDSDWVLGYAWVDEITSEPASKQQLRCPVCHKTQFGRRKNISPEYRCSPQGHEFDAPLSETIDVTGYIADYGRTWKCVDEPVPAHVLKPAYLNRSAQQSIRELSMERVREIASRWSNLGEQWWEPDGGIRPGGHTLVLHKARIGQTQFRNRLLQRFGGKCAITGPQPDEVLEAAHLYRYADIAHHDIRGGLLLRRDLHALFDRGLVTVSTTTWTVEVAPQIRLHDDYAHLHGQPLQVPARLRPDAQYLDEHRSQAVGTWTN